MGALLNHTTRAAPDESLASLSDSEIFEYMETSRSPREAAAKIPEESLLPSDFWELEPTESMLVFLDESRSTIHREKFDLVFEMAEGSVLPDLTRLSLDDSPSQCYSTGSRHYFYSNQPGNSYYASGRVRTPGGAELYDAVYSPTTYELAFAPLDDSAARSLTQRISSLPYIQVARRKDYRNTSRNNRVSRTWSSADGTGYLQFWTKQAPEAPTMWSSSLWSWGIELAKRFNYKIGDDERLNFANILLSREFPLKEGIHAAKTDEEVEAAVLSILSRCSLDQRNISNPIVQIAAETAGDRVCATARPLLQGILNQAPRAVPTTAALLENENELQNQIWSIAPKLRDYGVSYGQSTSTVPEAQALITLREALIEQRNAIEVSDQERERFGFQQSLEVALQQIHLADDVEALKDWVWTEAHGARWALRRLHEQHPKAYAEVLETSLQGGDHPKPGAVLNRIYISDKERGVRLAREWIEQTEEDELFIDCLRILQRADAVPDEADQVERLIELIRADFTNNYVRARALNILVPQKHPMRYTAAAVDDVLLYVVNPQNPFPDKGYNYASAAEALLQRDAARHYPIVIKNLDLISMPHQKERFLSQLTRYAQKLRPADRADCLDLVRAELSHSQNSMNSLLWMIWTNDLRQLSPELEKLATVGPKESESADAYQGNTERRQITGHFHLARQMSTLWSEPDPETRARLHIAFVYQYARNVGLHNEGQRTSVFSSALQGAVQRLNPETRRQLVDYSEWCRERTPLIGVNTERLEELHHSLVRLIAESH